jgi:hypothetical protein
MWSSRSMLHNFMFLSIGSQHNVTKSLQARL